MLSELRAKAEKAKNKKWWLWDDERPSAEYQPALDFAHTATPATILELFARMDKLEAVAAVARQYLDTGRGDLDGVLAALDEQESA